MENFLRGRKHQVSANGQKSSWSGVAIGVLLGTVLGSDLFSVFVNDLPSTLSSRIKIFADDTKIFNNLDEIKQLKKYLKHVKLRSDEWLIKPNPQKCSVLHMGNKNHSVIYNLNNMPLKQTVEKDLRILIQDDLKLDKFNEAVKRSNNDLRIIKQTFHYLDVSPLFKCKNIHSSTFGVLYTSLVLLPTERH